MIPIRNFCIIAHIDHGKSTLADRLLELTHTVEKRKAKDQMLDQMDLERERGITIKLAPVNMRYLYKGKEHHLNLIDTPGHVDFSYEVSRSLASVEGAILLVDATQGIEAQTLANLYLALEHHLTIIPVINKIDLPGARVDHVKKEIHQLLGVQEDDILCVSAKTGEGVPALLEAVVERIPPPILKDSESVRALIFDSLYDEFKGVVIYVRVFDGVINVGDTIRCMQTGKEGIITEVGEFLPGLNKTSSISKGSIGYVIGGFKNVRDVHVGDTMTVVGKEANEPLSGYKQLQPMVFAGIYAKEGNEYASLREALEKLSLNDASLSFEPDHSPALGFGFRCGFLGLLHLEIVSERLRREYSLDVIITVPSVAYRVYLNESGMNAWKRLTKERSPLFDGKARIITSALELPIESHIDHVEEPYVRVEIITPGTTLGNVMDLSVKSKGTILKTEFIDEERAIITIELPLASILVDFYDKLKGTSSGYASYSYDLVGYKHADVVRLDVLVAEDPVDALASLVDRNDAEREARKIVERLKENIPQQLFEVKIQATIGARIVASSRISPLRKDVTAKLYGGDVTRKRKLLEKQKKGKKRMRSFGKVDIPQEAFLAVVKR